VLVATQRAIAERDLATVRKHLILISDLFDRANAELMRQSVFSYSGSYYFWSNSAAHMEARSLLPRTDGACVENRQNWILKDAVPEFGRKPNLGSKESSVAVSP